jgi:hypothetical protein
VENTRALIREGALKPAKVGYGADALKALRQYAPGFADQDGIRVHWRAGPLQDFGFADNNCAGWRPPGRTRVEPVMGPQVFQPGRSWQMARVAGSPPLPDPLPFGNPTEIPQLPPAHGGPFTSRLAVSSPHR